MSNSQEQSLNENVVFLPVDESSPEFLHCEREREAVERLLSSGPEAFYGSIGTERSGCFLSPAEVSQITGWAQNYHFNQPQAQQENGVEISSDTEDFCSTYFPCESDMPTPNLELGWPEKDSWVVKGNVTVHSSPPAEGEPHVREVIRRHLQRATQVIAIVTDRLTDGAIIGDLHGVASQGVPIYIILNQRTIQENFTLNRLRHPNMRVRVLGGKSFCSRTGRMVFGEMKNKFILVDLDTVIHGSYSLTWTDAHLHRQLITVLTGPAVDSFDREFRILYAASLPVPDTWRATGRHASVAHQLKDFSDRGFHKQFPLEPDIISPPSPPADFLMDWEAMGVVQRDIMQGNPLDQPEKIVVQEMQLQNNMLFDNQTPIMDGFTHNEIQFVEKRRSFENTSPVTKAVPDKLPTFNKHPDPWSREPATAERMKRIERTIEKAVFRQLSNEKSANLHDGSPTRFDDQPTEPRNILSPLRREHPRRESILEEESSTDQSNVKVENKPSSRKPVILRLPNSGSFSSLSDIMKRLQRGSSGLLTKGPSSERTQSMMDLSIHNTDTKNDERAVPVPRFKGSFDPDPLTPALALMRKRNDDLKSALYRTPKTFLPRERPRSSSYAVNMDWRRSLTERGADQE